jgi:hypothetical protein
VPLSRWASYRVRAVEPEVLVVDVGYTLGGHEQITKKPSPPLAAEALIASRGATDGAEFRDSHRHSETSAAFSAPEQSSAKAAIADLS